MAADGNRSIELHVVNKASEEFVVFSAIFENNECQWLAGEQAKIGETLAPGGSTTWGVLTTDPNGSAVAEVRLKGSKGYNVGFKFQNTYNGISLVMVELAMGVNYDIQPSATGSQASCKAIISSVG